MITFETFFDEFVYYLGHGERFTSHLHLQKNCRLYCAHVAGDLFRLLAGTPVWAMSTPAEVVYLLWNWKSAILSIMLRVPVFAVAAARHGLEAMALATFAEAVVCGFNAGCYAAVVQIVRNRKPVWLTAMIIAVGLPTVGQVIEYKVHAWRGTPHAEVAVIVSTVLAAIASLFNWYAMKRGALLVGGESSSFGNDLRQFPLLLAHFFWLGPRWVLQRVGWIE